MRFRTAPCLLVVTLGLFGCDDRYLVGFGPDGAAGNGGSGAGGSGAGGSIAGASDGGVGGSGGSAAGGTGYGGEGGAAISGAGGSHFGGSGGTGYGGSAGTGYGGVGGGAGAGGMFAGAGGTTAGAGGSTSPPAGACERLPAPMPVHALNLSPDHVGERLARALWGERPDPATLARAATLRTSADVQAFARVMLEDPRAEAAVKTLMRRWLRLDELGSRLEHSTLDFGLRRESEFFATRLVLSEGGSLLNLLTASFTFTDSWDVAKFYGADTNTVGSIGFSKIIPDPAHQRSGILTQGAFLRANQRATARGAWLRTALMCQPIPLPPAESDVLPPSSTPPSTYRQRLVRAIDSTAACQGCHALTDPLGFALEHYDETGRWRNVDDGLPIDASASISLDAGSVAVNGSRSLGESLARSCVVQACAVHNFLEFAVGPLRPADDPSLIELQGAFALSGFNLKELLIAVTGSKVFLAP